MQLNNNVDWLAGALRNQTAVLECGGSYQPNLNRNIGSSAWTIECIPTGNKTMGVLPSTTIESNAYRSELIVIYASLILVLAVTEVHNITSGKLLTGCDNEKGLYLLSIMNDRVSPRQKYSDIMRAIRHIRCKLPIKVEFKHIYGNQYNEKAYEER